MRPFIALRAVGFLPFVLAGALPASGQGRNIPTIVLDRGAKEFPDPFSQLVGMIELRDGRVLLVDMKEKELRVVDFAKGTGAPVSRVGNGPLEYQAPGQLLGGVRDSILYYDMAQRRFLLLSPSARPVRTAPFGGTDVAAFLSAMRPAGADSSGRVYGETTGMTMPAAGAGAVPNVPTIADSVDIMWFDRRTGRTTAMARIRNVVAQSRPKIQMAGASVKLTINAPDFRAPDVWAVLPDGRVAILRDGVYRVHLIAVGHAETLGPILQYTPVPVTAGERKAVVDSLRKVLDATMQRIRKSAPGAERAPGFDFQVLEPPTWAATKPAYIGMRSSPDGRLWVGSSVPAGTKSARFDVLDKTGTLIAHVQLAADETLVGLGRGTVYTIRTDEDGLQHLRRYGLAGLP